MRPMDMNNIFILKDLVNLGGGQVMGRKKMQKIIYIIQEEFGNLFDPSFEFKWNFYGVYSDELASELSIGEFFNIFRETPVKKYDYLSYAIEVVDETVTETTSVIQNEQLNKLMRFLNDKESRLLEVLSSIIFFRGKGLPEEGIECELFKFKGHLRGFFDDAYAALEKVREISNSYLEI